MTVTDGDRLAVAISKLNEAQQAVNQATKIINYLFEVGEPNVEIPKRSRLTEPPEPCAIRSSISTDPDPVTGLYPGQKPDPELLIKHEDEETDECLE